MSRNLNEINGAQGRNRTTDTRIFSPLLYRLSYLGIASLQMGRKAGVIEGQGSGCPAAVFARAPPLAGGTRSAPSGAGVSRRGHCASHCRVTIELLIDLAQQFV
jgi:hypothetical protein